MKKTRQFMVLMAITMVMSMSAFTSVKAQFSENFDAVADGAMPTGWLLFNVDGKTPATQVNWVNKAWVCSSNIGSFSSKAAWSTSYYSPAGASNDWMFTPAIVVPATNPVLKYKVVSPDGTFRDGYELRIMTEAPTSGNLMTSTVLLTVPAAAATVTRKTIDLTDYAGQTVYIAWRNNSNDMFLLGVDDVEVRESVQNDIAAVSINNPSVLTVGNMSITGTVANSGSNNITSYDVMYKIDGGAPSAVYSVTGVNIATDASGTFTHNVPAALVVGTHTVEITLSNVNGTVDPIVLDNAVSKTFTVASQLVPRVCLFEGFSSSTCPPCKTWNSTFNPWASTNEANISVIKYQVNIPGSDPYAFSQTNDRRVYYGVNSAPNFFANGSSLELSVNGLNSAKAASGDTYFSISGAPSVSGKVITVPFTINPYFTVSGLKVRVAVCEKVTTGNVANNGETVFHNILMQMLPSAAGTTVDFVAGTDYLNTFTKDMTATHVEEMSDLVVVVFIQDDVTKKVLQSKTLSLPLNVENETMGNISIYPNPAKDNVRIKNAENSNIIVYDILGKTVMTESNISNDYNMNVSNLVKGNYIVKIMNGNQVVTKKIAII